MCHISLWFQGVGVGLIYGRFRADPCNSQRVQVANNLRFLVPKAKAFMIFGTRVLKSWVLGPWGYLDMVGMGYMDHKPYLDDQLA